MVDEFQGSTVVVLLAVWLFAGGCSWIMVRSAPPDYAPRAADQPPPCTPSLGPAIGDTWDTIAVGGGLAALGTLSLTTSAESFMIADDPALAVTQIAGGAGLGAMFGASAHYGYRNARRCRRLRDAFQRHLHDRVERLETE